MKLFALIGLLIVSLLPFIFSVRFIKLISAISMLFIAYQLLPIIVVSACLCIPSLAKLATVGD